MTNAKNDFKQEIVSEMVLQLLPTIYGKAIDDADNSWLLQWDNWREGVVADAFLLAEAYYNYKEKILERSVRMSVAIGD